MDRISEKPIMNQGRQVEMDVLKGSFIFLIFVVHSFQLLGNAEALQSAAYQGIFSVGMFTGASLFLFFMGFGLAYSRKQNARDIAGSGIKWIGYQFLSNLCNMIVLLLPLGCYILIGRSIEEEVLIIKGLAPYVLLMLNIFYIAGVIQLLMAFFRRIRMPLYGYLIVALVVSATSPFLAQLSNSNRILEAIIRMFFTAGGTVSFAVWPYISFTAIGYFFGRYFLTCGEKSLFYKRALPITIPISIAYITWILLSNEQLPIIFDYLHNQYMYPNVLKCIATTAILISLAGVIDPILNQGKKWGRGGQYIFGVIHFFSKHISKLYAVHIGVYFFVFGILQYNSQGTRACLLLSIPVSIGTILIVMAYVKYESHLKNLDKKKRKFYTKS
ncbi:MAG: heparan-alpha-glucosaminide N-acetyltransferase domain-containing protein [Eubacteriales bacterium]